MNKTEQVRTTSRTTPVLSQRSRTVDTSDRGRKISHLWDLSDKEGSNLKDVLILTEVGAEEAKTETEAEEAEVAEAGRTGAVVAVVEVLVVVIEAVVKEEDTGRLTTRAAVATAAMVCSIRDLQSST